MRSYKFYSCFIFLLLPALFLAPSVSGKEVQGNLEQSELTTLGERIYREGVLPSGKSLIGFIKGDVLSPGTSFSCESCHMRSGLGSFEGSVLTIPTNGAALYNPRAPFRGLRSGGMAMGGIKSERQPLLPPRPAYTDETLADALRGGADPTGRVFNEIMPRYNLSDSDMRLLVSYVKNLSVEFSPGVDATTLHLATVITDDLPLIKYTQHLALLDEFISKTNEHTGYFETGVKKIRIKRQLIASGRVAHRKITLSRWLLKGSPETWRSQLLDYYRKEPVFALIGGMSGSAWKPIHDFCEEIHLPSLFPQTLLPVISESDWYTLYLSKGFYLEGETAVRYLNRSTTFTKKGKVLLIVRDSPEGGMLADGFVALWSSSAYAEAHLIKRQIKDELTAARLAELIKSDQPDAVVIWDDASLIPVLNGLPAAAGDVLPMILLSSSYLGSSFVELCEQMRKNTFITYPERLPSEEKEREAFFFGTAPVMANPNGAGISSSAKQTYPLIRVIARALSEMKEQFYRDYFLDIIAMSQDLDVPLYERLSFGPGQRYASKGCYIVQLGPGKKPELIKRSEWVIH